jgi:nucleotide-binding universal stress UspA family protein
MGTPARKTDRDAGYRRILWPTDFSPLSKAAVPHAVKLAAGREAELIVLHVQSPVAVYVPPAAAAVAWDRFDKEMRAASEEQLRRVTEEVTGAARGVRVRSLLVVGSPFDQIPRVAKRQRCDLIVLATHGRTGLGHLFMGSVAENVVRRAPCPVLTVRPSRAKR